MAATPGTITSATSVYQLAIGGLFPSPVQLQGFAADEAFSADTIEPSEVLIGVDGFISGGWLPTIKTQSITLQADSISMDVFDTWFNAQTTNRLLYIANGIIMVPSVQTQWTLVQGYLSMYTPMPDHRRVLQPRRFAIKWGQMVASPLVI